MALIQTSSLISSIKGSVGGVTYSSNKSGLVVKKRLTGKKSVNSKQLSALNLSKGVIATWSSLSYGVKTDWSDFSSLYTFTDKFGVTKTLTGMNWFMSVNMNRTLLGVAIVTIPPTYEVPSALPPFYINMSDTTIEIVWADVVDDSMVDILVFASAPSRGQARFERGAYRLLDITGIDYTSSFDITDAWEIATGLVYAASVGNGNANVNILIVPVSKSSYISGLAQSSTSQVPRVGIGFMAIGTTFIVS